MFRVINPNSDGNGGFEIDGNGQNGGWLWIRYVCYPILAVSAYFETAIAAWIWISKPAAAPSVGPNVSLWAPWQLIRVSRAW